MLTNASLTSMDHYRWSGRNILILPGNSLGKHEGITKHIIGLQASGPAQSLVQTGREETRAAPSTPPGPEPREGGGGVGWAGVGWGAVWGVSLSLSKNAYGALGRLQMEDVT